MIVIQHEIISNIVGLFDGFVSTADRCFYKNPGEVYHWRSAV